jgi:hypothetical protein
MTAVISMAEAGEAGVDIEYEGLVLRQEEVIEAMRDILLQDVDVVEQEQQIAELFVIADGDEPTERMLWGFALQAAGRLRRAS